MIYLGYFSVVERLTKGSSGDRHGVVTLAVDASNIRQAGRRFHRKLEELRDQTTFFDNVCEIYMQSVVELPVMPRRYAVAAHCEMYDHVDTGCVFASVMGRAPRGAKMWEARTDDHDIVDPFEEFDRPKDPEEHAITRRDAERLVKRERVRTAEMEAAAQVGLALAAISELEFHLSQAFCLDRQTLTQMSIATATERVLTRKRLTLGQLIRAAEKDWIISHDVEQRLRRILTARNALMHGLVKRPSYRLTTARGRRNLSRFLARLSEDLAIASVPVAGAYYLSRALMVAVASGDGESPRRMSRRETRAVSHFHRAFTPRA